MADREPAGASDRLGDEMTGTGTHDTHDLLLVAALADGTLDASERTGADMLIRDCPQCASLRDDLLAIRSATVALPTPSRPRDFRLSAEDAARLRPSGWRAFVGWIGTSRDAVSRPLAIGLTTLGIAGLLVATIPSMWTGVAPTVGLGAGSAGSVATDTANDGSRQAPAVAPGASAPAAGATGSKSVPLASAAASAVQPNASGAYLEDAGSPPPVPAASSVAQPVPTTGDLAGSGGSGSGGSVAETGGRPPVAAPDEVEAGASSVLAVVSIGCLAVGVGLLAVRWAARRTTR